MTLRRSALTELVRLLHSHDHSCDQVYVRLSRPFRARLQLRGAPVELCSGVAPSGQVASTVTLLLTQPEVRSYLLDIDPSWTFCPETLCRTSLPQDAPVAPGLEAWESV
jgi:hypothetical protein